MKQVLYKEYYRSIVIDWPRKFTSWTANANPESDRSVERHYKVMKRRDVLEMCAKIKELAHPDGCHVWNWTSGPFDAQTHEEFRYMGARYSSIGFYWVKMKKSEAEQISIVSTSIHDIEGLMHVGLGHTTRKNIEHVKLARFGSPRRRSKKVRELIFEPIREHSRKPEQFYQRVEEYCEGPYCELFARGSRPGWHTWGDEHDKFDAPIPKVKKHRVEIIKPPPMRIVDPNQVEMFNA